MLVGLAAVNGRPLASNEASGCKVALAPTQPQPQNAAANILYSKLLEFVISHVATMFPVRSSVERN